MLVRRRRNPNVRGRSATMHVPQRGSASGIRICVTALRYRFWWALSQGSSRYASQPWVVAFQCQYPNGVPDRVRVSAQPRCGKGFGCRVPRVALATLRNPALCCETASRLGKEEPRVLGPRSRRGGSETRRSAMTRDTPSRRDPFRG